MLACVFLVRLQLVLTCKIHENRNHYTTVFPYSREKENVRIIFSSLILYLCIKKSVYEGAIKMMMEFLSGLTCSPSGTNKYIFYCAWMWFFYLYTITERTLIKKTSGKESDEFSKVFLFALQVAALLFYSSVVVVKLWFLENFRS